MLRQNVLAFEQLHGTRCEDVRRFCNFVLSSQHSLSGGVTPPSSQSDNPTTKRTRRSNSPSFTTQQPTAQQANTQYTATLQNNTRQANTQQPITDQTASLSSIQQPTVQQQVNTQSRKRETEQQQTTNQLASPPSTPLTASTTFNGLQTPATLPTQKHGQTRSAYLEEHGKDYFDEHGQTLADAMEFHEKNKGPTRAPPNTEDPAFKTPSTEKIPRRTSNGVSAEGDQNNPKENLLSKFNNAGNTTDDSDAGEANTTNQPGPMQALINSQRQEIGKEPL